MKKYLVEVAFKKWIKDTPNNGVIDYYEVDAYDGDCAIKIATDSFEIDYKYKPWVKKYMKQFNATLYDVEVSGVIKI